VTAVELAALLESPPYVASTLTLDGKDPVTKTEQVPADERAQLGEENVTPPGPDSAQVTFSPATEPAYPLKVAKQPTGTPRARDVDPHETVRTGLAALTVSLPAFELGALLRSPPYDALTVTTPAVTPVSDTEHRPLLRTQLSLAKATVPLPAWDQSTVPVGEKPVTKAVHLAGSDAALVRVGVQATAVLEIPGTTSRLKLVEDRP